MPKNSRVPLRCNKASIPKEPYMRMTKNSNKELENINKCPICMEYPHNAILLICSNHHKGCRPFMCNGPRQFNCRDQYHATSATRDQLTCPMCRGQVLGERVVVRVREYMNSKVRSCENEACEFNGTWEELAWHWWDRHYEEEVARSEEELRRKREWEKKQDEWEFRDLISGYATEPAPPIQGVNVFVSIVVRFAHHVTQTHF